MAREVLDAIVELERTGDIADPEAEAAEAAEDGTGDEETDG